jgi:DNA-binding LacI/PurR family transcriptional regulator
VKRVTIKEIAQATGYSKTAVSFAFNRPERISAEALSAILAAAEELAYFPDPLARNLSRSRSDTIGLLLPQPLEQAFQNPYIVEIVRGAGKACHENEMILSIIPPVKGRYQELAAEAAVDGLLALGLGPDAEVFDSAEKRKLPFVAIDGGPFPEAPSVGVDDLAASRELARLLWEMGHRRILLLGLSAPAPPETYHYSGIHALRAQGVMEIFAPGEVHRQECEAALEAGMAAARSFLQDAPGSQDGGELPVSVVLSFSDIAALGFIRVLRDSGFAVPGDISVVGFDGIAEGALLSPPLAGVRQPGFSKGEEAARLLFGMMAGVEVSSLLLEWGILPSGTLAPYNFWPES